MEMACHILHLSSINVINGLELSREQARELCEMAREVEAAGGYIPAMKDALPGDLAEMRKTHVHLAEVLLRDADMSEELGRRGTLKPAQVAARVDGILNKGQKIALEEFSCCLVPPRELSDPTRIGQAEVSDRKLELLRSVRAVPEARWPQTRERIVSRLVVALTFRKTGAGALELTRYADTLRATLDRTRSLSDIDFELDKRKLCAELGPAAPAPPDAPRQRLFKQAFFLLMPGSTQAYDALLKRMHSEGR